MSGFFDRPIAWQRTSADTVERVRDIAVHADQRAPTSFIDAIAATAMSAAINAYSIASPLSCRLSA